jgi:hypothetical protein
MMIKTLSLTLLTAIGLSVAATPVTARSDEQGKAREQMRRGGVLSLREIEGLIIPRMRGMEYLGPEYDPDAKVYRLKFINKGRVIFVDIDARTGDIIRQH